MVMEGQALEGTVFGREDFEAGKPELCTSASVCLKPTFKRLSDSLTAPTDPGRSNKAKVACAAMETRVERDPPCCMEEFSSRYRDGQREMD